MGWNLGNKGSSIHLFDPLTSIPIRGTKINKNKNNINSNLDTLIKSSCLSEEKKNYKKYPNQYK